MGSYYGNSDFANEQEYLDSGCDVTEKRPFSVGHSVDSHTTTISYMVGRYLGTGACVAIIDTQGFADTRGDDARYVRDLARSLQHNFEDGVNVFLLLFKSTANRFNQWTQEQLGIYETIFGKKFWKHAMTAFTFWRHNAMSHLGREQLMGHKCAEDPSLDCGDGMTPELMKHEEWNDAYREKLEVAEGIEVPTVFIDAVLPVFSSNEAYRNLVEPRESGAFEKYTTELWEFANSQPPFKCDGNCKAPSGAYVGEPWIPQENVIKYKGKNVTLTCQVWTRFNRRAGNNLQWLQGDKIIYQLPALPQYYSTIPKAGSLPGLSFSEETSDLGLGITSTLFIESMDAEFEGTYSCKNDVSQSKAQVLMREDCRWGEWSEWSRCSKDCVDENSGQLGFAKRSRPSVAPRNGGRDCEEIDGIDVRNCPHQDEADPASGIKFCSGKNSLMKGMASSIIIST